MAFSVSYIYEIVDRYSAKMKAITKSTDTASRSLARASKKAKDLSKNLTSAGKAATLKMTLPILALSGAMIKGAASLEEVNSKTGAVFKENTKDVMEWSKTSIDAFGMSKRAALDSASLFGSMANGMKLSKEKSLDMSKGLVALAGDMSSFFDVSEEVAKTSLSGVFTGETEAFKKFGVVMTEVNLKAHAASKGMSQDLKKFSQADKVALRYSFIMDTLKDVHGDYARTSASASNQTRKLKGVTQNLSDTFGTELLPIYTKAIEKTNELVQKFSELEPSSKRIILVIAGIVAVIGPLLMILGQVVIGVVLIAKAFGMAAPMIMKVWRFMKKVAGIFRVLGTLAGSISGAIVVGIGIAIYQFNKLVNMAGSVEVAFMSIGVAIKNMFIVVAGWIGANFIAPILGHINTLLAAANSLGAEFKAIDIPDFEGIARDARDVNLRQLDQAVKLNQANKNINNNNIDIKIDNKGAAPKATASSGGSGNLGLTVAGAAG